MPTAYRNLQSEASRTWVGEVMMDVGDDLNLSKALIRMRAGRHTYLSTARVGWFGLHDVMRNDAISSTSFAPGHRCSSNTLPQQIHHNLQAIVSTNTYLELSTAADLRPTKFSVVQGQAYIMLSSTLSSLTELFSGRKPWQSSALGDMLLWHWHLGLTSFGGPAVHFQIVGAIDQGAGRSR
ncbi:hypothetical protein XANCAGTX0491_001326 [Xanthoria calcicola]